MSLPNVVLLTLDACRADHLSGYGYDRPTTPHIDRIAAHGVLYEKAISAAVWTVPSHASLFTGRYLSGHGLYGRNLKLRSDIPTLAGFLGEQGYKTVGFTANALVGQATGLSRGFGHVQDVRNIIQGERLAGWQKKINALYRRAYYGRNPSQGSWYDSGAKRLNYDMMRWIRAHSAGEQPFFIFANYMETHLRYDPPRAFRKRFLTPAQERRWQEVNQNAWQYMSGAVTMTSDDWDILTALYDAELAYVDRRIGQIADFLREEGLWENTLFIVTSDHGENLGEHGLMDHQYCVYDTLARVPLVVCYPGGMAAGSREAALTQTLDIFPTVVDLLGIEAPGLQGRSLRPEALAENGREFTVTEYLAPQLHSFRRENVAVDDKFERQLRAIRTQAYKYIWASDGRHELYHLAADPGERHNLIEAEPEIAQALAQKLTQWLEQYEAEMPDEALEDEQIINRLEALGYI